MSAATQVQMLKHWSRYLAKFHLGFAVAIADRKVTMDEVIRGLGHPRLVFDPPDEDDWCGPARPDFDDRGGAS